MPSRNPHNPAFVTVLARNYLGLALTMAESVARHHPDLPIYLCFMDDREGVCSELVAARGFRALRIEDVDLPERLRLVYQYDVIEASTAVKPFVLRHLLRGEHDQLVFLDPDLWCLGPMTEVFALLATHALVLTPHVVAPIPEGLATDELQILSCGVFNLGFLALRRAGGEAFLDWWAGRLTTGAVSRPKEGYFFDQKWLDLAPAFCPSVAVLRHRGYNVAWWNAHERTVTGEAPAWRIAETGEPLVFMHFSALPPADDDRLSRNVVQDGPRVGYTLATRPDLAPIFAGYRAALAANAADSFKRLRYAYSMYDDGSWVLPEERDRYWRSPQLRAARPNPFARNAPAKAAAGGMLTGLAAAARAFLPAGLRKAP